MIILTFILALVSGGFIFFEQKQFGNLPTGTRRERIYHSPNYRGGSFQNRNETPQLAEGATIVKILKEYLNPSFNREPSIPLPIVHTELTQLSGNKPQVIWFGHSSYLICVEGKKILVDPVFSGNASPVTFCGKNYTGSNEYPIDRFPDIDFVIITHDHYDHLDYKTIVQLKKKAKHFYTSLGVGAHLAYWGIEEHRITEFDWWEEIHIEPAITIRATPARHFSGRKFKRNQTLWASYIIKTPALNLFLGGDSGYDSHFKEIGEKYGPFDLALLECGQYNTMWRYIHMLPDETAQAAVDLNAKVLMPVHWSKFTLALHEWNEPIKEVVEEASKRQLKVTTPMIGQPVIINEHYPDSTWWNF